MGRTPVGADDDRDLKLAAHAGTRGARASRHATRAASESEIAWRASTSTASSSEASPSKVAGGSSTSEGGGGAGASLCANAASSAGESPSNRSSNGADALPPNSQLVHGVRSFAFLARAIAELDPLAARGHLLDARLRPAPRDVRVGGQLDGLEWP